MILVPTTILAQQHFGTFRERLADLPFVVEGVSRLRKPAEVKTVLADFRSDDPGADDDPRPAALRHLPRAPRRPALRRRGRLPPAQAGRGENGAGRFQI